MIFVCKISLLNSKWKEIWLRIKINKQKDLIEIISKVSANKNIYEKSMGISKENKFLFHPKVVQKIKFLCIWLLTSQLQCDPSLR